MLSASRQKFTYVLADNFLLLFKADKTSEPHDMYRVDDCVLTMSDEDGLCLLAVEMPHPEPAALRILVSVTSSDQASARCHCCSSPVALSGRRGPMRLVRQRCGLCAACLGCLTVDVTPHVQVDRFPRPASAHRHSVSAPVENTCEPTHGVGVVH